MVLQTPKECVSTLLWDWSHLPCPKLLSFLQAFDWKRAASVLGCHGFLCFRILAVAGGPEPLCLHLAGGSKAEMTMLTTGRIGRTDRKDMEITLTKNVSVKRLSNSILWIILCFKQVALSPHVLALWCRLGYFHSYAFVDLDPIWTPRTQSRVERRDGVHLVGGSGKKRLTFTTLVEWQDAPISVDVGPGKMAKRWSPPRWNVATFMVQVEIPTSIRWDMLGWGLVSSQSRAASGILECLCWRRGSRHFQRQKQDSSDTMIHKWVKSWKSKRASPKSLSKTY